MKQLIDWFAPQMNSSSFAEKLISGVGGFAAILTILLVNYLLIGDALNSNWIVASMGASAVLLFAVPQGALSQPWPLVGGHLISALVGVLCFWLIPWPLAAAACSVGMAILAMYLLGCLHPPGGATALAYTLSPGLQSAGFAYLLVPVGINVLILLLVALLFNQLVPWRYYPANRRPEMSRLSSEDAQRLAPISHENLVYALSEIDSFVDIQEQDLLRIYELATRNSHPELTSRKNDNVG